MRRSAVSIPYPGPFPSLCHPDIPGITFDKEKGWDFHGAPDNMNFALPVGTDGGDIYPRAAEFTEKHYEQKDTSLNKQIWGDLPETMAELEALATTVDDTLQGLAPGGQYILPDREVLFVRIAAFEKERTKACLGTLLRLLDSADAAHLPAGSNPALIFLQKAQATKFEQLSAAIKRTKRLVDTIGSIYTAKGKHDAAAARYALALLDLYPWVNSPRLFTSDKAFEGIAPLSADLWGKLSQACVSHAQGLLGIDDDAAASWAQDALRVAQLCVSERFTTRGKLYAAFQVMSMAQILSVTPAERRAWAGDACSSAQAEAKLRDGQALMRSTWAALFLSAEFGTHCKHLDTWAHADCLIGHSCGTYGNFLNFMQWGPAQAQVHQVGQMAIQYEPRPCEFKNGLPFYCARGSCSETPKEYFIATPGA